MRCKRCGKDLEGSMRCNFCGFENEEGNVRELSRIEKNFFDGVTIDNDSPDEQRSGYENFRSGRTFGGGNFYVFGNGGGGFFSRIVTKFVGALMNDNRLAKIAAILIGVAVVGLTLFVALPILFFILAIGIALFAFTQMFKR